MNRTGQFQADTPAVETIRRLIRDHGPLTVPEMAERSGYSLGYLHNARRHMTLHGELQPVSRIGTVWRLR